MAHWTDVSGKRAVEEAGPPSDKAAAGVVIGAHGLKHFYQHGFLVVLAHLHEVLGLSGVALGLLEAARRSAAGAATMLGGFILDRFQEKRIMVLYLAMVSLGLGYALVGVAPTYVVILVAVAVAGSAGSIWHPAALGLLSQRYPEQRGFMLSLHRSVGSLGDTMGPVVIGALLGVMMWQGILYGALPPALITALVLWVVLRKATTWQVFNTKPTERRKMGEQLRSLGELFKNRALIMLLLVAGLSGLGQGGLMLWMLVYLRETQGMDSFWQGVHLALLTGAGIAAGPIIGRFSDKVGRKPVIMGVLAVKATIAALLAMAGLAEVMIAFTLLVAMMGAVMFAVNSLIQAGALDLAEGRKLEGSMIGLLWGSNAVFIGASPLMAGFLIDQLGFHVLFWYVAVMNAIALAAAAALPNLNQSRKPRA